MNTSEHICAHCSKSIPSEGPVIFRKRQMLHLRCLSGQTQLRSMEAVENAREALAETERLLAETDRMLQEGEKLTKPGRPAELPPAESA